MLSKTSMPGTEEPVGPFLLGYFFFFCYMRKEKKGVLIAPCSEDVPY